MDMDVFSICCKVGRRARAADPTCLTSTYASGCIVREHTTLDIANNTVLINRAVRRSVAASSCEFLIIVCYTGHEYKHEGGALRARTSCPLNRFIKINMSFFDNSIGIDALRRDTIRRSVY